MKSRNRRMSNTRFDNKAIKMLNEEKDRLMKLLFNESEMLITVERGMTKVHMMFEQNLTIRNEEWKTFVNRKFNYNKNPEEFRKILYAFKKDVEQSIERGRKKAYYDYVKRLGENKYFMEILDEHIDEYYKEYKPTETTAYQVILSLDPKRHGLLWK